MRIKKIMKWSVITMAMMAGICLAPQSGKAAEKLEVKIPTERAIYQRDNNNYANVKVSIEYSGTGEVSAKLYDGDKELGKTAVLTKGEGNTYEGSIANVPGGGWYTLIVNAGSESKTVEKVGVGEVFITGGQSNSCNFGGEKQLLNQIWYQHIIRILTRGSIVRTVSRVKVDIIPVMAVAPHGLPWETP